VPISFGEECDPPLFAVAEDYTWESSDFDCSLRETAALTAPSAFVHTRAGLRWSGRDASWLEESESIAMAFVGKRDYYSSCALIAREEWLRSFLSGNDLALVVFTKGERRRLAAKETYSYPSLEFCSVVAFAADGSVHHVKHHVNEHVPRE
jgi:hypothetical protein